MGDTTNTESNYVDSNVNFYINMTSIVSMTGSARIIPYFSFYKK